MSYISHFSLNHRIGNLCEYRWQVSLQQADYSVALRGGFKDYVSIVSVKSQLADYVVYYGD